jgi:predicted HicB family RNase H-like nuclease
MKMNEMRNGSLYYNKVTERVERMVGVVSKVRVLTYHHKQDEKSVQVKHLRKATTKEVEQYLEPAQTKLEELRGRIKAQFSRIGSLLKSS